MKRKCGSCGELGHNRRTCGILNHLVTAALEGGVSAQQQSLTSAEDRHQEPHVHTQTDASASSSKDDIIEQLSKCPVCLDYPMMPPLWTICKDNRHVICNTCFHKLKGDPDIQPPACPQCREVFIPFPMQNRTRLARVLSWSSYPIPDLSVCIHALQVCWQIKLQRSLASSRARMDAVPPTPMRDGRRIPLYARTRPWSARSGTRQTNVRAGNATSVAHLLNSTHM